MRRILTIMLLALCCTIVSANDTIMVDNAQIEKLVEHKTTNSKGNPVVKYYFIYKKDLVVTSKSVADKYKLCKQYNANCPLILVRTKSGKRITSAK